MLDIPQITSRSLHIIPIKIIEGFELVLSRSSFPSGQVESTICHLHRKINQRFAANYVFHPTLFTISIIRKQSLPQHSSVIRNGASSWMIMEISIYLPNLLRQQRQFKIHTLSAGILIPQKYCLFIPPCSKY